MAKKKVYAVKVGKIPGIYDTWDECKEQVNGYPGAEYKGFADRAEAEQYMQPKQMGDVSAASGQSATELLQNVQAIPGQGFQKPVKSAKPMQEAPKIPDGPYAFVDGSFNAETGVYGYGGYLVNDGKKYPLMGSGSNSEVSGMRNVAGELMGSIAAVKKAEELGLSHISMLYDYKGIQEFVKPTGRIRWKAKEVGSQAYQKFMLSPKRTVDVDFIKVKGHSGIDGNEDADVMAKTSVGIRLTGPEQRRFDAIMKKHSRTGIELDVPDVDPSVQFD